MTKTTLCSLGHVAIAELQTIHGSPFVVVHKPCWNMTEAALLRDWLNQAVPASALETSPAPNGGMKLTCENCGHEPCAEWCGGSAGATLNRRTAP